VINRRDWLRAAAVVGGGAWIGTSSAKAQQTPGRAQLAETSNLFAMDQSAARSVRMPPKPGAIASMTPAQRDELEHRIRCQCGCTLDVYTCRTTDFSCQVSPQMHRDVLSLVDGGYTDREILDAFVNAYGEQVLMAPPRYGFNLLAYVLPGIALAIGAVVLAIVIRRWRRPGASMATSGPAATFQATPEEIADLEAAIRNDS
jgi:cytochrome c-type biogenesis protein CcmH